ncbi:universal stress protein [Clavibacter michiganensis]|uniref:universal stress protein n=2 Tax=Clavibacter michiganensis TaxID=28447 RepID=UPI000B6FDFFE|nr:universal stress protein [Clavibacter michiganensis]MDO4032100.1 universal stress protein [Clavibacter michiganensis]MDO4081318.1 universal stress protein [Clavibacter michiganensis]MDO4087496.1 universal stress protein [Clavibacter michiganensis]MDO4097192.1 universal stress protein [Clavibacter michiganensis]MDO4100138.1 universal stress protein [Clavibacter michiganensis]
MSVHLPSAARLLMQASPAAAARRRAVVDLDREAVVVDAAAALERRFPPASHEHVMALAGEAYTAIVGPGVPVRGYLRNLVVHRARGRLAGERSRAAAGDVPSADVPPAADVALPTVVPPAIDAEPAAAVRPAPGWDSRPIAVGFDGSPASESAVDRALLIAGSLGVPVRLVAAWQYPMAFARFPLAEWTPAAHAQSLMDASVAARFGGAPPTWLTTATVEGPAAPVLLAESRDAQMLVVGSRGHGGFAGLLLGSVSSACAEHAECPVLVMHAPRVEHEDPVSAGAEALGDGSRATDAPAWAGA